MYRDLAHQRLDPAVQMPHEGCEYHGQRHDARHGHRRAEAAQELEDVQQAMNDCPIIRDMRDAQKKYQDMMDNVNRILRLVVTGETEDDKGGQPTSGCTGNCASCQEHCNDKQKKNPPKQQ
mgnify:CR=1 FL=1